MTSVHKKLIVAGIVLGGAVGYLAFAGVQKGWVYFLKVDDYAAHLDDHRDRRVKLSGKVAGEGVFEDRAALVARFPLVGESSQVPVVYKGVIPDMFKPGHEVIVEGKLDSAGVFQADVLMTKCASKYEAGEKHPAVPADHPGVVVD